MKFILLDCCLSILLDISIKTLYKTYNYRYIFRCYYLKKSMQYIIKMKKQPKSGYNLY